VKAHELETGLVNLTFSPRALDPPADDGAFVAKPRRRRRVSETHRHESRDLRRHVRPERHDFARLRLDEPEHLTRIERPEVMLEYFRVFERGHAHRLVPEAGKAPEKGADERQLSGRFLR